MASTASFQHQSPELDPERTTAHAPPIVSALPDEPTVITSGHADGAFSAPIPPHELARMLAGEKLGHYELLEFAGGGGMGAVFRARDTMLGREVAIKVLSRDQAGDDEMLKRFKNEAQSAARLDHDNIARVYYVGEDRGLNYIVFEYVEGRNIRQLVDQNGPLSLPRAVSLVLQVADALAHAATRDVVHRDIKPSNIVITSQGKAKLVDMGLARFQGLHPGADLTASGVTLGTFDYISPEQARDPRTADVRSDIYSLGCTLYFMLTGRPPFPEGTVLQKLLQHNSDDPIDPREFNRNLPDAVVTLLRKMLAKDPARRYQTPTELIADLLHFAEPLGLNPADVTARWESAGAPPTALVRHLTWLVPAVCLVLAFAVFESWERRTDRRWRDAWMENRTGAESEVRIQAPTNPPPGTPVVASNGERLTPPTPGSPGNSAVALVPVTVPTEGPPATATTSTPTIAPPTDGAAEEGTVAVDSPPRGLPPPRDGVLVVCDVEGEGRFPSLRAACFAARNGDVVELCYDGPRLEKPLVLNNLKVTVRAGAGYRPVVQFRPGGVLIPNAPRAMFTVVGGRIDWIGVALEFDVPSPQDLPTDRWTLFDLQYAEHLGLERSIITVRNAADGGPSYHPDTAVFGMSSPPGVPTMMNEETPVAAAADSVDIRLDHCIVRGETSLLRAAEVQSAALTWENGLLAVADSVLVVRGGQSPPRGPGIQLHLRHVTAALGGEFVRVVDDFESPYLQKIAVRCTDSLITSAAGRPLLDFQGVDARAEFLSDFEWTAERVIYDGYAADGFWRIASAAEGTQTLSYDEWLLHWGPQRELQTAREPVRWTRPPGERGPFQAATPLEYALNPQATDNRALGGAGDGTDLGLNREQLPQLGDAAEATAP